MILTDGGWYRRGFSTRSDGNGKEGPVQDLILTRLGRSAGDLVTAGQVHSDRVAWVKGAAVRVFPETDGLLTEDSGRVIGIFAADCMPIYLADPQRRAVGLVHAGWRGAAQNIFTRAARELLAGSGAGRLAVHIGPHIKACCYEVGPEVCGRFPAACRSRRGGRAYLSLQDAIWEEARGLGVRAQNFSCEPACTGCGPDLYSFRRERTESRMLAFIVKELE